MEITPFLLFLLSIRLVSGATDQVINVLDHGAVGDGVHDDTQAFMKAWTTACIFSTGWPTILVPSGKTFLLSPLTFEGPCLYVSIHVRVEGNIVAPDKLWTSQNTTSWITFRDINAFTVDGNGQIDGRGSVWWDCKTKNKCDSVPSALGILRCVDLTIAGIKLLNSPGKHLTVDSSKWVHLKGLSFASPADSPDTDGIYIVESHYVEVKDAAIGAGGDCIAIGTGSSGVNITGIACGLGRGISIGSSAGNGSSVIVEDVHVSNGSFYQSDGGLRVQTWQGGSGHAKGILFEHINFTSVGSPIVIDQFYCPGAHCKNSTSTVEVSDVRFVDVHGTSTTDVAIKFACNEKVPCTGIILDNVGITSVARQNQATSYCLNAKGKKIHEVIPDIACLA